MLILSRHKNEQVKIRITEENLMELLDEIRRTKAPIEISVILVDIRGDKARIGVAAPTYLTVHRDEVQRRVDREHGHV